MRSYCQSSSEQGEQGIDSNMNNLLYDSYMMKNSAGEMRASFKASPVGVSNEGQYPVCSQTTTTTDALPLMMMITDYIINFSCNFPA